MERRECTDVIAKMIEKIPSDKAELIKDLQWNYEDASYKAPEETLQWERTHSTIMKHLANPVEEWEFEVLSVFTTHPVERLKEWVAEENKSK